MTWQPTMSGVMFTPLELRPQDVYLVDVIHALAAKVRWTGHSPRFYSIAEHSCYVADQAVAAGMEGDAVLLALLHDATEAYLPDMAGWLKPHMTIRLGPPKPVDWVADPAEELTFRELEDRIMAAILERLQLDPELWQATHEQIKREDSAVCHAEAQQLFPHVRGPWPRWWPPPPDGLVVRGWMPHEAAAEFRARFNQYSHGRYAKWLAG